MKKYLQVTLGIVAALGGFVEIGDLVFNAQAGAKFGYSLLWALAVGTAGIIIYGEMSGRVAAVAKKTSFDLIREQYPPKLGFFTLVVSMVSNVMTCAAEIGGVALVLMLLSGFSYPLLIGVALLAIIIILWFLPFEGIEKLFGYLGVGLVVFMVAAIKTFPGGETVMSDMLPHVSDGSDWLTYGYMAVGIIAATLVPYEVYFYSSGGIEDKWKAKDGITTNRMNSIVGFGLGAVVAAGIMAVAAHVLLPAKISPETLGQTALTVAGPFGSVGLLLVLLGMLFAIAGAAVEAAFAGGYTLSQYAGWKWGKRHQPWKAPRFTAAWLAVLLAAGAIVVTGINPIQLTEYAVIFAVIIMPLTYYPILRAARNPALMGKYVLGRTGSVLGVIFLGIIAVVAVAAVPLMVLSGGGQ